MVDKQKIIQYWQVEKKSEVDISTELGISRNTVRRYLKSYSRALEQCRITGQGQPVLEEFLLTIPHYNSVNRGKRKLTPEIMQMIVDYLQENTLKRQQGKHKQVLKKIDIWELLQSSGQDIGYTVVCDYIRFKASGHHEAFIRQEYEPGENCEFDWCEIQLAIDGVERKLYLAVFTMCNKPSARNEAKVAGSVGKQLDRVAAETPVIRQEQEEKQREAAQIEGADTPLPAGFGPSLERVRRGGKHSDSR